MSESVAGTSKVGELLDAYLGALQSGSAPPREQLLAEHPELAAALDGLEFIHRATLQLPATPPSAGEGLERQLLGDFRLMREVGRGGMAVVYEAEQVSLGRRVALKVLPFAAVLDSKQLQRFKNEALAAAHLHHAHIVPVYAVGCERGVHYYAMQLVDGQSLALVIREMREPASGREPKTPISSHGSNRDPGYVRMAVTLGVQAAEALDHAHELGVVHRDIKPGNLLLDGAGDLWITDFGLARSVEGDLTITGELLGTFRYMSPEQTRAKRAPMDHRTDVYSLGVTLYELLTLQPAFPGDDPHEVMQDIAQKDPVSPRRLNPTLPVDLETILLKSMAKDPSSRYATAQEMADDLGRFLADQPIHARRPSLAARSAKWARRHRGFVAAAAVVLLLGVAALVVDKFRVGAEQKRTRDALDTANANLRLARSAVDKFLVEIGVSGMADQPLPQPARQRLLELALRLYERNFDDPTAAGSRVTIFHALHRYDDAVALLDEELRLERSVSWASMQRGHMLWHLKQHEEALAALGRALEIDEKNAEAHAFRACVLRDLERPADALAEAERALALNDKVSGFHSYRGSALADLGRTEDALAEFDRAIALDASAAPPWIGRADALSSLGRHELALTAYDRALLIDPTAASAQSNRGRTLERLGRPDDALAAHQEAVRLDPTLLQARINLGVAHLSREELDDAAAQFLEVLRVEPRHAGAHVNLGCVYNKRKEWDKAIAENRAALEIKPDLGTAMINLGSALASTGRFDEALALFQKAIELGGNDADAYANLGDAQREHGNLKEALAAYVQVTKLRPDYAHAHYCVGRVLAMTGQHQEAVAAFREASRCDAKLASAHVERGNSLLALGQPDAAIEAYVEALRIDPTAAEAAYMQGKAYYAKRDSAREIAAYEAAIRIRRNYAAAHSNLGRALNDRRDFDGAIRELTAALDIDPNLAEAHLNLAISLSEKKDPDQAIAHCRIAVELLSGSVLVDPPARTPRDAHDANVLALVYNTLGCALDDKGETKEAIEAFRAAIRADPKSAPAHYNLAKQLYGASIDAEAEAEFLAAIELESDMAEAWCGLGRLYTAQGRFREALTRLKQGHELGTRRGRWTMKSADWIAQVERRLALEDRLEKIVSGEGTPRDALERVELALLLYSKTRYRESAEFWEKAFAQDASFADDLKMSHRYNAACAGVLAAATGGPEDAPWRAKSLRWLRTDLAAREKAGLTSTLGHWRGDQDFRSVREEAAALPAKERDEWASLWADVEALAPKTADRGGP